MSVYSKLLEVQKKLKAPKSQFNSFGKYNYRNCEDILEAVKPLLAETNLTLSMSDELVTIGNRYYIKAIATIYDDKGESISVTSFAREEEDKKGMDGSQITGAASSYARKYALNGLFLIDDTKDSDSTNGNKEVAKETVSQTITSNCSDCKKPLQEKTASFSKSRYGKELCFDCQKKNQPITTKSVEKPKEVIKANDIEIDIDNLPF
jgi:hypothetical protein